MVGALPPVFAGLPPEHQHEAASYLTPITVEPGEAIMIEGELDTTLAFIAGGTCEIWRGETKVGTAGTREMIGEVELFGQLPRVCSITAATPVHLQVLAPEGYIALAESGNPVVFHLERAVIRRICERITKLDEAMSQYTRGAPLALNPKQPSLVDKLTAAFRKKPKAPDLDKVDVLRRSELFAWAPEELLRALAGHFEVDRFDAEQVIYKQGADADRMYLIASGAAEIVVELGVDRVQPVTRLGAGHAFGDVALGRGTPGSASIVSREEIVALVLDRHRFRELFDADEQVSSAFRQGLVRNLILRLLPTMDRYALALAAATPADEGMYKGTPVNAMWRG